MSTNAKGSSLGGREEGITRNKKITNGKAHLEKHRVKGGNFPYTNISKPAIIRRVQRHNIGNAFEIKRPET